MSGALASFAILFSAGALLSMEAMIRKSFRLSNLANSISTSRSGLGFQKTQRNSLNISSHTTLYKDQTLSKRYNTSGFRNRLKRKMKNETILSIETLLLTLKAFILSTNSNRQHGFIWLIFLVGKRKKPTWIRFSTNWMPTRTETSQKMSF